MQVPPSEISANFLISRTYFTDFKVSKHFLKVIRKSAREDCNSRRKSLTLWKQTLSGLSLILNELINGRFQIGRLLLLSGLFTWLALNSFGINFFSILNYSMILVIVLFPQLTPISSSASVSYTHLTLPTILLV